MLTKMSVNPAGAEIVTELLDLDIEPVPDCYEAWFYHRSGEIAALSRKIEQLLETGAQITQERLHRLHTLYCKPLHLADILPDLTSSFEGPANEVNNIANTLVKSSEELNSDTAEAIESLDKPDLKKIEINGIVKHLSKRAQHSIERNRSLEKDLSHAVSEIQMLKVSLAKVERDAQHDPLTQLYNRRYIDSRMKKEMNRAKKESLPLCVIVGDIDHFKRFNDTWGHKVGDQALKFVSNVLSQNTKGKDVVARYGGEEFLILLPETRIKDAAILAENIRNVLNRRKLIKKSTNEELGFVTMSFGVAQMSPVSTPKSIFEAADIALYRAKHEGRNRVITTLDPIGADKKISA